MAANEIDLSTVAVLASTLGVTADAELQRLLTAASAAIATHLGYGLHLRSITEDVAGPGGPHLFLKAGQINSISSITVGGSVVPGTQYRLTSQRFGRISGSGFPFTGSGTGGIAPEALTSFPDGTIQVAFSAGWVTPGQKALDASKTTTLPAEIEQAVIEVVVAWWRRRGRDADVASFSMGGGSFGFQDKHALPVTARQLLAPYRKRLGSTP